VKRLIFLVGIIFCGTVVLGQITSPKGWFQVSQDRGCVPLTIKFTNLRPGQCILTPPATPCSIDYLGNNMSIQGAPTQTFTYLQAGTYILKVSYQLADQDDSIVITVEPNIQPTFDLSICGNNKATIKITDPNNYLNYRVDFGSGFLPPSTTKNYTSPPFSPGPQTIKVVGVNPNSDGTLPSPTCSSTSQSFTALAALVAPQINTLTAGDLLTATNISQASLDFTPQPNTQTRIDISVNNATSFGTLKTSSGVTNEVISNLNLDNNYYCFRLSAFDPCTNSPDASTRVGPICSHRFSVTAKDGVPVVTPNGSMQLDWLTNGNSATTDINRNSTSYQQNLPGIPSTFLDPDIICNTEYRYKIVSKYNWGGKSISLEKRAKSFTTLKPATIINTSSVVSANDVQLNWKQDPKSTTTAYNLFRSQNQGTFFSLASSPTFQYQDGTYNSNADFCYLINYKDQCNNGSLDSSPICPIRLRGSVNNKNEVSLSWNDYTGWNLGVKNYIVEKFDQNGNPLPASGSIVGKTYVELSDVQNQVVSYRIMANANEAGLAPSISNQITFTKDINLFYPTAFTPDSKGPTENENFKVGGQFIAKFELSIFDRWGSLIFFTDKNEPWDGTQSGQPMPVATYVWTANIVDMAGRSLKRSGTVLLLRK
jgi:gliding motility-associated-like protein